VEAAPAPVLEPEEAFPDVDPEASPEARFALFRGWLDNEGPRYQVWANDCIFIAINPPFLDLEFPVGFRHSHVSATNHDERLLEGVQKFFPGCSKARVRNRAEGSEQLTHREAVAKDAAEAQAELERLVAENEDIQQIALAFDAAILSVHKDHHAPTPPALDKDGSR
jgi:hypothetical protein